MKKFILNLVMVFVMLFTFNSCASTYAYTTTDDAVVLVDQDVTVIIESGIPYYYNGVLEYYLYNGIYYYPYFYDGVRYWHHVRRPYTHGYFHTHRPYLHYHNNHHGHDAHKPHGDNRPHVQPNRLTYRGNGMTPRSSTRVTVDRPVNRTPQVNRSVPNTSTRVVTRGGTPQRSSSFSGTRGGSSNSRPQGGRR